MITFYEDLNDYKLAHLHYMKTIKAREWADTREKLRENLKHQILERCDQANNGTGLSQLYKEERKGELKTTKKHLKVC